MSGTFYMVHILQFKPVRLYFVTNFESRGILSFSYCMTVEKLANTGAKMVVISNSSRRASTTIEKLKSLGFDPSLFVGAITSGELTHQYLQRFATVSLVIKDQKFHLFLNL